MRHVDGRLTFSATDLTNFLECEHLTQLDVLRARGEIELIEREDPGGDLIRRKGIEHEQAYLERLKGEGRDVAEIPEGPEGPAATIEAMRRGAEVVYQAAFDDGEWTGYADFLFRVETPSDLGGWSYEPADTKLAREPKPYFLLQLCSYAEQLARLQGVAPERVHLVLGDGRLEAYRRADFDAYYRTIKARFLEEVARARETYPWPVRHCDICRWKDRCASQREADDHLSLVASIRRSQILRLNESGILTMEALAKAAPPVAVPRIGAGTAERLRLQAELQVHRRETGEHRYELLPPDGRRRGFALLPEPCDGDVFFDMEGDPFAEGGLEYLFGVVTVDGGSPAYRAWWAHQRLEEKRALEELVDFITERLTRWPDLHVYHYASYEPSALKRLMGTHGTREEEVDRLLRGGVLVDLYAVVRQGVRISQPSYSLKMVEAFYMPPRTEAITEAGSSIVAYERWIDTADADLLHQIEEYNAVDCASTYLLREWLLGLRAEAASRFAPVEAPAPVSGEPTEEARAAAAERAEVAAALTGALPDPAAERMPEERARWLLAQLLEWHRREEKPEWWAFFERLGQTPEELMDDAECIGCLEPDERAPPERVKRSLVHTIRFPAQETKIGAGADVVDPATGKGPGEIVSVDPADGVLRLKRRATRTEPLPQAIIPAGPRSSTVLSDALRRLGRAVAADGIRGSGPYRAARDLLLQERPRVRGIAPGEPLASDVDDPVERAVQLVRDLDESALFVQGPPGSGKTYTAARVICAMIAEGKRVGVAANAHKAIHRLLLEVEEAAREAGLSFRGVKKSADGADSVFKGHFVESIGDAGTIASRLGEFDLLAGTAWLFAREDLDQALDVLFVDEAGQVSLANALAMAMAARNLVLVGDPQQLAQPTKGFHPEGAGVSVLEHLLGDAATIPADRGLFLARTWRMHPDVCAFISDLMYEGRLRARPENARQAVAGDGALGGTGLRFLPVAHDGNVQRSQEEAERIAPEVGALVGREWTDKDGNSHELGLSDVLVVTPYNAQVHCLREALPPGSSVGTVDKFQGQQAPAVFFSMATSSGEELPRTLEFLFSRNRLNVAVSRARCLSILVASPRLLHVRCRTVEQMRMVNALCRFVEMAT